MAAAQRLSKISPVALAALWLLAAGAPARSQTVGEVVVEAPEVVHEVLGRTPSGGTDELVSVSHHVRLTDLDLTKTADAATLQDRISGAAKLGCGQLEKLYPLAPHDPDCVKKAIDRAQPQVRAALALR